MKRYLSLLLILTTLLSLLCFPAAAGEDVGLTFTDDLYRTTKAVTQPIRTYEAWLRFPTSMKNTRGGAIFGCSINDYDTAHTIDFEVMAGGAPRLLWKTNDRATTCDMTFNNVKLFTGKKLHLAITFDNERGEAKCYVDGVLKQTLKVSPMSALVAGVPFGIGGTPYSGNPFYFRGELFSAAAYSDCRTPEEIKQDMLLADTNDSSLVFSYETEDMVSGETMYDYGKHGYDAELIDMWMTEEEMQEYREQAGYADYAYSIAVVGDTQTISNHFPDQLHYIYDWIVENAESKKISFVQGLGDMTDLSEAREYELVIAQLEKLDGIVPYAFIRGNHDTPDTFKQNFPYKYYGGQPEESFDGTMLNTYQTIRLGNVDFLILCLDYCPSDEVLNWANKIVKNHPNHNVIISTHSYLSDKGTPLSEKVTGNDGAGMWNKLISKHKNIVLTLSGHITWDEIVIAQAQGSKGNTVTQILVDPQGTDGTLKGRMADGLVGGLVAMLYFSEDGRQVAVEYVSTARNQYYMSSNLQSFTLDIQDIAQDRANEYARSVENALASAITKDNFATKKVVIASLREEYEVMSAAVKAKVPAQTLALLQEAEQTIADFESPTVPQEQIPNEEQQKQPKEAPSVLLPILIGIGVAVITAAVILLAIGKKKKTAQ